MSLHRKPKSQQAFLLEAMQRMDMDADQFARRLGASRRRLDDWLRSPGEPGFVELDPVIWTFVREIVERAREPDNRDSAAAPLSTLDGPELPAVLPQAAAVGPDGRWLA
jgi:hypothetical protein